MFKVESDRIRETILKYSILNAVQHEGKAQNGPVLSKLIAEHPEARNLVKEIMPIIAETVSDVNSWGLERQRRILEERWPELLESKPVEEKKGLPPLPNVERFKQIRTRFAPNPDGPLHLGSARPIILCNEYAKMYNGRFILRFEDTSPDVKAPIVEMYDWIMEDLEWLGAKPDEVYIQSDRIELYYKYAEKLIEAGSAYVCLCKPTKFKELYFAGKPCPCRDLPPDEHLKRWGRMLNGTYEKGGAVVRIKTDLNHPNPAIRDWPALRISTSPHPRIGSKYHVWPLYNFSCAIDDHEMMVSHIIRGKEHEVNTLRQRYLFEHLGWEYPEIINVGRLGLEVGILSKSKIMLGFRSGEFSGWDDPRLGTLRALRRRGITPEAIRRIMIEVGPKPINATLSWTNIASTNRKIIEPKANRYFYVEEPVEIRTIGVEETFTVKLPLHPDHMERGFMEHIIKPDDGKVVLLIAKKDLENLRIGGVVRLMGLFNVKITAIDDGIVTAQYYSKGHQEARALEAPFLHWVDSSSIEASVVMPDASISRGRAEQNCLQLSVDDVIQFERFGFVRVDSISPFKTYFAHQ